MFRLLVVLAALLFAKPAAAESAFEVSIKRAPYSRGEAVRAGICFSTAMRPVMAPASLVNFAAMMEGNVESAKKFDDGKITAEQYIAEIHARWQEFAAKTDDA